MSKKDTKNKNPFQDTLNLPKTDFSIRANAKEKEPELLKRWQESELYKKAMTCNEGRERYVLHDGPPYANGNIHIGTAFNKILKDIVCKYKRMAGYHVPFVPGWDCHGLPIELKVTSELGVENKRETIDPIKFKKSCREYAQKWIDTHKQEFQNLGVLAQWDKPYITMDPAYEADILRALAIFVEKGHIERKGKTVPWCASCQTVLAAAEIEYKDRKDPSMYILFEVPTQTTRSVLPFLYEHNPELTVNFLIWTTTPWTIPLNRAVVLHPKAEYCVLAGKKENEAFIVARKLADKICEEFGIEKKELATFDAQAFVDQKVVHPINSDLLVPIILDHSVTLDDGTACVHSAPGCGPEDYFLGVKNNLEIYSPLSADGKYTDEIKPEELKDMPITDGQIWVIKKLAHSGRLLHKASIRHSYPHCWRCRNGLMFRATDQWFCNLEKNALVQKTLNEMKSIDFVPDWGHARLESFVKNRTEWCISRQRMWDVPIPAIICTSCDHAHIDATFVKAIADHVEQEGIEYWDRVTLKDLQASGILAKDFCCPACKNNDVGMFRKERDILDVWFDSGVSHMAVLDKDKRLGVPADLYLEGSDQHRGWFQSSLLCSMIVREKTCAKTILTHGFVVDQNKIKMSKSLGNVVAPNDIIGKYSRDILRLWVASIDFESDMVISEKVLKNICEVYRKIRNTCRFMISNLYDFDIRKDAVSFDNLLRIDQYVLMRLHELQARVLEEYEQFNGTRVVSLLNNFCTNDLSAMYLDILKDRLYVEEPDSLLRRSGQTAMYHILDTLTHLMAPILSFLAEEVSDFYMPEKHDKNESIHERNFPELIDIVRMTTEKVKANHVKALERGVRVEDTVSLSAQFQEQGAWVLLEELRAVVLKAIEEKRQTGVIKHSLEAKVTLYFDTQNNEKKDGIAALEQFLNDLNVKKDRMRFFKDWFIVSQVSFADSPESLEKTNLDWAYVNVEHADGVKCPRCWQWDQTHKTAHVSIHCEKHEDDKQVELEIASSADPVPQEGLLCQRCKEIVTKRKQ